MALHTDTDLYKATYELTLLVTKFVAMMPRNFRADFGTDLRHDCARLVRRVYQTNTSGDKVTPLRTLREELAGVDLSLRLAMDLRLISHGQYGQAIGITTSISKQATGWQHSSEKALVSPPSRRSGQRVK
jgi:hypothetical protein